MKYICDFDFLKSIWAFQLKKAYHCKIQFSSVAQSCPTLCDPLNCSTPSLRVHHQLPEFTQTHVDRVGDAIQPSLIRWFYLDFFRNYHSLFHSGCTSLCFHQQGTRVLTFPHPCQHAAVLC